jgi:hypothetical protein
LSKFRNAAQAGVVGRLRRRTTLPTKADRLRRTAVMSCAVMIGSLVLARVVIASRLLLVPVLMVFVIAAITLFAAVVIRSQEWANEIDAADPLPVRNRHVVSRPLKQHGSNAIASAGRVSRAGLSSVAPVVTGLRSRFASVVAVVRREVTRDSVRQWLRATTDALSGTSPPHVSPPTDASEGERASRPVGTLYGDAQSGVASPNSPDLRPGHPVKDRVV